MDCYHFEHAPKAIFSALLHVMITNHYQFMCADNLASFNEPRMCGWVAVMYKNNDLSSCIVLLEIVGALPCGYGNDIMILQYWQGASLV